MKNAWKPDEYTGPQGESIPGEGVKLEVWQRMEGQWRWNVEWFGVNYTGGVVKTDEGLEPCMTIDMAKTAVVTQFKALMNQLQIQFERASALKELL